MTFRSRCAPAVASLLGLSLLLLAPLQTAADDPGAGTVDLGDAEPAEPQPEPPPTRRERAFQVWESSFDLVILRPLGVGATLGGGAFFLASFPFVAPTKNWPVTWDIFVLGPFDYTFVRPLGEF